MSDDKKKLSDAALEKLWRGIDEAIDADDALDVDVYLKQQGVTDVPADSVNLELENLLSHTFDATSIKDEQFQGKYKIIEQLDSGGQSDVFLAERSDGIYQQTVVIKFISQRFNQSTLKQQFLQEMQLLADLAHPGVVSIIDGNVTEQGQPWLVLDYIDGPHIDTYCQNNQLTTTDVVGLVMSLCDALQFIHKRGVLHKDLKPSNVLVKLINDVPHPVLIDFGIAMAVDEAAELNFGTRGFSAPEQVAGEKLDQRSDLFSLGVLLGYLLLKVQGRDVEINDPINIHNALQQYEVPKDLQKVVQQLTATEKSKRYQSADAVRSDLNQWLLGFPLSFDSNKLSSVLKKTVQRHPWATVALLLALGAGMYFTAKYTRDVQHLQALTIAEKNETDELMNFMLDDLYENLERIGRIDVLQTVAEKSVAHLAKQDPLTIDQAGHFQAAKAYTNTGRVFDYLEQSAKAQQMFQSAESHLNQLQKVGAGGLNYHKQLAQLRVYQSQVLSSAGQEQATEAVLREAIKAMQVVLKLDPNHDQSVLWEANLELGYHLMEYAKAQAAKQQINTTLRLAAEQLALKPDDASWLYSNSQSHQMKAWYELDFGDLNQGIKDVQQAIEYAQASIKQDFDDLKKQNNERILYNQLAYFQLENEQLSTAKAAVLQALKMGEALKLKAPYNQEYEREHAYSFSTAGEIYQTEGALDQALHHYQQGLEISKRNYSKDPTNYSAANDYAVDSLLVADLLQQTGNQTAAMELFVAMEKIMQPVHLAESNNKYYAHTLLVIKLQLMKLDEAKALFDLASSNDMVDGVIEALLIKHQLDEWLTSS